MGHEQSMPVLLEVMMPSKQKAQQLGSNKRLNNVTVKMNPTKQNVTMLPNYTLPRALN